MNQLLTFYPNRIIIIRKWCESAKSYFVGTYLKGICIMENNVIILAGGQGKRMKTNMPKALCNVIGEPMLEWVLTACENAELDDICVVKGYEGQQLISALLCRKSDLAQVMLLCRRLIFLRLTLRETHLYSAATLLLSMQKLSRVRWSFILKRTAA